MDTSDTTLPDQLNQFYTRFDRNNTDPAPVLTYICEQPFCIEEREVKRTIRRLNARKGSGANGITPRLLQTYVDQLTPVLTDVYNWRRRKYRPATNALSLLLYRKRMP